MDPKANNINMLKQILLGENINLCVPDVITPKPLNLMYHKDYLMNLFALSQWRNMLKYFYCGNYLLVYETYKQIGVNRLNSEIASDIKREIVNTIEATLVRVICIAVECGKMGGTSHKNIPCLDEFISELPDILS